MHTMVSCTTSRLKTKIVYYTKRLREVLTEKFQNTKRKAENALEKTK